MAQPPAAGTLQLLVSSNVDQEAPKGKLGLQHALYYNHRKDTGSKATYAGPGFTREAGSYMKYIVDNYDRLPDAVAFLHDDVDTHNPVWTRWLHCLRRDVDFVSLAPVVLHLGQQALASQNGLATVAELPSSPSSPRGSPTCCLINVQSRETIRALPRRAYQQLFAATSGPIPVDGRNVSLSPWCARSLSPHPRAWGRVAWASLRFPLGPHRVTPRRRRDFEFGYHKMIPPTPRSLKAELNGTWRDPCEHFRCEEPQCGPRYIRYSPARPPLHQGHARKQAGSEQLQWEQDVCGVQDLHLPETIRMEPVDVRERVVVTCAQADFGDGKSGSRPAGYSGEATPAKSSWELCHAYHTGVESYLAFVRQGCAASAQAKLEFAQSATAKLTGDFVKGADAASSRFRRTESGKYLRSGDVIGAATRDVAALVGDALAAAADADSEQPSWQLGTLKYDPCLSTSYRGLGGSAKVALANGHACALIRCWLPCCSACAQRDWCVSWSWDMQTSSCLLSERTKAELAQRSPTSQQGPRSSGRGQSLKPSHGRVVGQVMPAVAPARRTWQILRSEK